MNKWKFIYVTGLSVSALAILVAGYLEVSSFLQAKKLDKLRDEVLINPSPVSDTVVGPVEVPVVDPETGETSFVFVDENLNCPVDFFALWDTNSDIYGWLRIPGTVIDYPVVQHVGDEPGEDYYLRRDLEGNYSSPGVLFSQYAYNKDFDTDCLTVIYGHHMRNDTMFGELDQYSDASFAESHPFVYMYTAYNSYRYRVVGVISHDNSNILYTYNAAYPEGFADFCDDFNSGALGGGWKEDGFVLDYDDQALVLSTCSTMYSDRMLVVAVLEERQ